MAATSTENNMKIEQVKTAPHEKRVATHSHIKGLGLRADGTAEPIQSGFVGQENAREVCSSIRHPHTRVYLPIFNLSRPVVLWSR